MPQNISTFGDALEWAKTFGAMIVDALLDIKLELADIESTLRSFQDGVNVTANIESMDWP